MVFLLFVFLFVYLVCLPRGHSLSIRNTKQANVGKTRYLGKDREGYEAPEKLLFIPSLLSSLGQSIDLCLGLLLPHMNAAKCTRFKKFYDDHKPSVSLHVLTEPDNLHKEDK